MDFRDLYYKGLDPDFHASQDPIVSVKIKSKAKIYRNSRKLNQSINGGSHDFQM